MVMVSQIDWTAVCERVSPRATCVWPTHTSDRSGCVVTLANSRCPQVAFLPSLLAFTNLFTQRLIHIWKCTLLFRWLHNFLSRTIVYGWFVQKDKASDMRARNQVGLIMTRIICSQLALALHSRPAESTSLQSCRYKQIEKSNLYVNMPPTRMLS